MIDEFGFQIPNEVTTEEVRNFTKIIIDWHKQKHQLTPEDVLNFLVEESVISFDEIRMLMNEKTEEVYLPKTKYFFN